MSSFKPWEFFLKLKEPLMNSVELVLLYHMYKSVLYFILLKNIQKCFY